MPFHTPCRTPFRRRRPSRPRTRRSAGLAAAFTVAALLGACGRSEDLPATHSKPIPVRLETLQAAPFQPTLELLGTVEPRDTVVILARTTGPIRYPAGFASGLRSGISVRAGQLLAIQEDPGAANQLEVARLNAQAALRELERHRQSWEEGLESDAAFRTYELQAELALQQRKAAEEAARQRELRAPVDGRLEVENRYPPGAVIEAGTPLAEILTEARQVRAWTSSEDRDLLEVGLPVRIRGTRGDGPEVDGIVETIAPSVSRGGAFAVVIQPEDPRTLPAPGEGVEVEVLLERRLQALTVPEEALVVTADGASVFVARRSDGELLAERRDVTLGFRSGDRRSGGRVEVLRGVSRGDRVVVTGAALLSDEAAIVAVEEPLPDDIVAPVPAE